MANIINRILCPVDLSDQSRHALDYGVGLQRHFGASLTALQVIPPPIPPISTLELPAYPTYIYTPEDLEAIERHLRAFVDADRTDVRIATRVTEGFVVSQILDSAAAMKTDLIVMGTRGRGAVPRLFLGSVAERVIGAAACPVLAVPPRMPDAAPIGQLFETVLCAVDFTPASLKALDYARSLAAESHAALTLVHVVEVPIEEPALAAGVSDAAHDNVFVTSARGRLQQALTASGTSDGKAGIITRSGKSYRGILEVAREQHADLIVLGAHGGLASTLGLGSTTHRVLREATCPVLTVHA